MPHNIFVIPVSGIGLIRSKSKDKRRLIKSKLNAEKIQRLQCAPKSIFLIVEKSMLLLGLFFAK